MVVWLDVDLRRPPSGSGCPATGRCWRSTRARCSAPCWRPGARSTPRWRPHRRRPGAASPRTSSPRCWPSSAPRDRAMRRVTGRRRAALRRRHRAGCAGGARAWCSPARPRAAVVHAPPLAAAAGAAVDDAAERRGGRRGRGRCPTARRPRPPRSRRGVGGVRPARADPLRRRRRRRRGSGHRPGRVPRRHLGARACGWCRCPRACSAWSTPRSAARPASTPRAGKNLVGAFHPPVGRARRHRPAGRAARARSSAPAWPRWSSAASSPTRRSSSCSRPTRSRRRRHRELVERAVQVKAAAVGEDLYDSRPPRVPQLRAHARPRDRAGRGLRAGGTARRSRWAWCSRPSWPGGPGS